jgi:hypothetical protein
MSEKPTNQMKNIGQPADAWTGLNYNTAASLRTSLVECLLSVPEERLNTYLRDVPGGCLYELCEEIIEARKTTARFFDR